MAALSDGQIQAIEQQLNAHPEITQALSANMQRQGPRGGRLAYVNSQFADQRAPASDIYRQFGINFPDAEDYNIVRDQRTGQLHLDRHGFWSRNADWLIPVITFATAGVGSAIAAGAGAGAGAGTSAGVGIGETGAHVGLAGSGFGTAAASAGTGAGLTAAQRIEQGATTGLDTAKNLSGGGSGTNEHLIRALAGLAPLLLSHTGSSSSNDGGIFGGDNEKKSAIDAQIAQMLKLQNERALESQPIHQAAMRLAGQLAPTSQSSPRLDAAIAQAGAPMPQGGMDPQVSAALARLMGGG